MYQMKQSISYVVLDLTKIFQENNILTLKDLFISESCIEIKIKLNFYFHTSLWCLKRFYEGLTLSGIVTLRVKLFKTFIFYKI